MIGICRLDDQAILAEPIQNPDIERLATPCAHGKQRHWRRALMSLWRTLRTRWRHHPQRLTGTHAIVFLYENPRDLMPNELGCDWLEDAHAHRACLRANETAAVIASTFACSAMMRNRILGPPVMWI